MARASVKGIFFDFDGVLTTEASGSRFTCRSLAGLSGIPYEHLFREYSIYNEDLLRGKLTHEGVLPLLSESLGREIGPGLLHEAFIDTPIDGKMAALAARLKRRGCKIGMITDNKKDRIDAIMEFHGWDGLFGAVAISAVVGGRKDEPEIFEYALKAINLRADECAFIDNSEKNLTVPAKMGFETIFFDDKKRDHAALDKILAQLLAM
ncbi:MAG: HAD-IA family hydrolase [Defluviitaleaceae bacterium]|nr:HAD-IA family hydrolase [Defluviitaleaceae bacterium]